MHDSHRESGGARVALSQALPRAHRGELDEDDRRALALDWGEDKLDDEVYQALIEIDAARRAARRRRGGGAGGRRGEVRQAWAGAVPWAIRDRHAVPPATWAVLGVIIKRAGESGADRAVAITLSELQSRLGKASRDTVVAAVRRLEQERLIAVDRERCSYHYSKTNRYRLLHPAALAAARCPRQRGERRARSAEALKRGPAAARQSPVPTVSPPNQTHTQASKTKTTTNLHVAHDPNTASRTTSPPIATDSESCRVRQRNHPLNSTVPTGPTPRMVQRLAHWAAQTLGYDEPNVWALGEHILGQEFPAFAAYQWHQAKQRHGIRAPLAVLEAACLMRARAGSTTEIRSAESYLGGILRRAPAECRPETTLHRMSTGT